MPGTAAESGQQGVNDQDPDSVLAFAPRVCRPEADALFCACTAWRAFEVVAELERQIRRPVVTSHAVDAAAIVPPGLVQSSESDSRCMCRDEFQSKVDIVAQTCDVRNTEREDFEKC